MNRIIRYFMQGLLSIAPLGITVYIIYIIFTFIDGLLDETLQSILKVDIPGLGILIIVIILILAGLIGQTFIAKPFQYVIKQFINKTPPLKVLYSTLNDLFSAVIGKEKKFNKPVLVLVNPMTNLSKLGFVTEEDLTKLDEKDKVAVYFPHSYNFSGELFIVPKEQIKPLKINSAEAMKFIVSAGVSGWEGNNTKTMN